MAGFHRKHVVRLLRGHSIDHEPKHGYGHRIYDEAVREALVITWEAEDRICGKRLKAVFLLWWRSWIDRAICSSIWKYEDACSCQAPQRWTDFCGRYEKRLNPRGGDGRGARSRTRLSLSEPPPAGIASRLDIWNCRVSSSIRWICFIGFGNSRRR